MSELREVVPDESVRLRALAAVSDALVGATTDLAMDAVLKRLVCGARGLVGARYAALGVPDGEGGFARFITDGMDDELVSALGPLPRSHGLLDAMLTQPTPYRTADVRRDPRFRGWWPPRHPDMRSFLGYPILLRGDVIGAFYLTDKIGADAFDETDEQLVGVFAPHAAVLVEHSRLYEESRELSVAGERDRIARELHDALTQTLFGARLAVQTAAHALGDEPDVGTAVERLGRASRLLDEAFGELRALIYDLRPPDLAADGLVGALRKHLDLVARTTELAVDLDVDLDGAAPAPTPETERQLFRIAQEAVANVVRHAGATTLTVRLGPTDRAALRLEVEDDGVGFDPSEPTIRSRRLGLTSMSDRARAVGGRLTIDSRPGAGTRVVAEAPRG